MTSEVSLIQGKTAGDLYDFVQAAAWRGVISESLSAHLRAALKKIFSATAEPGEYWRDLPLVADISDRIAILRTRNAGECSEPTIEAYRRRYDRSLRLFLEHQDLTSTPPALPSKTPPASPAPELLAMQKVLEASLKFQQEVLSALALLTSQKGGPPSQAP